MPEAQMPRIISLTYGIAFLLWIGLTASSAVSAPLKVVTTVAPITDMVKQIGKETMDLHGLVPEGVNSHLFSPTPGDVRYLAEADLIILNGLYLEIPTEKLAHRSSKPGAVIFKLGDQTVQQADWVFDESFPKAQGYPNPHLWLNVAHAMTYVTLIRDQLIALDPTHQTTYQSRTAAYLQQLKQLDHCIAISIATIPSPKRQLLTYHDSWPYFARRYGMTVIGAIQPASFAEPSARDVVQIINQIRQAKVPAIFGSEVFPSKVLAKIADETQVQYVDTLRDDDLPGEPGDPQHSYVGMMLANVSTMLTALGGDLKELETCWAQHLNH
jgi:ABC-type Zn uptake system ZnuABC Zn-binding protein ZnuA